MDYALKLKDDASSSKTISDFEFSLKLLGVIYSIVVPLIDIGVKM